MSHPKHFAGRSTAGSADTTKPTPEQIVQWTSHPREAQGRLQHHDQECDECNGTGDDPEFADCEEPEACLHCDQGNWRWGSWYVDDKKDCDDCGEDKPLGRMFDRTQDVGHCIEYVCFTCYVKTHKIACGCDKWEWAEEALSV